MDMIPIQKTHGFSKEFSRKFRDVLFVNDPEDERLVTEYLKTRNISLEKMMVKNSDWVLKRVRRYVPSPSELYPVVKKLFEVYGNAICSVSGNKLFDKKAWKVSNMVLEAIRLGHVSDPPGVSWYYRMSKDQNGLQVYRCVRGTNSVEGGVHQNIIRKFSSFNASPALTDCVLADYRLRHNITVGSKNRYGVIHKTHFSPWINQAINFLRAEMKQNVLPSYSDSSGNTLFLAASSETFGICRMPEQLIDTYHMQRNTTNYDNGNCYQKFESMTVKSKLVLCVSPTVQVTNRNKSVFGGLQHLYLSYMLGTKIAVTPVHTEEEMELYLLLRRNNPSLANQVFSEKTWQDFTILWSQQCNDGKKKNIFYKTPENLRHYFNQREDQSRYLNSVILNKERVDSASTLIKESYEKRPLEEANRFLLLPGQTIMPNIQNSKEIHQQDNASSTSKPLPKIMPSQYIYAQNSNMPPNFNYSMHPNNMFPSRLPQNLMLQNLMSQNLMSQNPMPHNPMSQNLMSQNPMPHNPMPHNPMPHNPMPHNPMPQNPMPQNPMPQNLMNLPLSPSHTTSRKHRLLYSNTPPPTVMCESNPKRKKTRTCALCHSNICPGSSKRKYCTYKPQ
ncbi:uncharacterized protein EV154DRAFT_581873 [Mucor mucedo]|uniref:uncharacterized protein n=1 Tax=Mucor mucedo TaxID=29922 RepID=UPI00221E9106|nr:uncharacterized protein EV154DRAFT_581873 [Mucor mucedo]KAI7893695.1 hypothetical protein EV154DRAFT_581873 [Mucor mucedo]